MRLIRFAFAYVLPWVAEVRSASMIKRSSIFATDRGYVTEVKHHLEEKKSWDNHRRRLEFKSIEDGIEDVSDYEVANANDTEHTPYTIKHKKPKKHIPFADGSTQHGLMIDAGSQGTRLHIYEWEKRFLLDQDDLLEVAHGKKLSYPTSNSRWTDKYTPGLDVFAYHKTPEKLKEAVAGYLGALLDFARHILKEKKEYWSTYPIFLKATGGVRTLSKPERVRLMNTVRDLFSNSSFNPFSFNDEQARVISGEEEAIYGWVGVNFAKGILIDESEGVGVSHNPQLTYGMLEMGGASTQIANFENNGDLVANLFKLQLGGARHWNVYVHSYLYTGINGAWSRMNSKMHWQGGDTNPCLPVGSEFEFSSWMHLNEKGQFLPRSDPRSTPFTAMMSNNGTVYNHAACSEATYALLRKEANADWCDFEMDGSCGFAGIYQPPMPQVNKDVDEFVATSNFVDVYEFLQLGEKTAIKNIETAAKSVCSLSWEELKDYNSKLTSPIDEELVLAQYCFRSMFVYQMLRNGWGFNDDYILTAVDVINGQKMGWTLGCMLYEINALPWDFHPELLMRGPPLWLVILYVILGTLGGSLIGFMVAMRVSKKFNKRVRESKFFQNTGLADSTLVRKSLAMPDLRASLEELEQLYEDDEKDALNKEGATKYT